MKKTLLLLTLVLLASQLLAVSNLKVNGAASTTITSSPAILIVTCDLAATGNDVEFNTYYDANNSKTLDAEDILTGFAVITDGIGWIRDPGNPDEDIFGDETEADKKLQTTLEFKPEDSVSFMGSMIILIEDKDGSQATALLSFAIQPVPPIIKGKITDKTGGAALSNIMVFASKKDYDKGVFVITDDNGNYQLGVSAGTWTVIAMDYTKQEYAPSDSEIVTVGADLIVTKDFQLEKYRSFIEGTAKKQDGTAVPGIMIIYEAIDPQGPTGMIYTDNNGYYKIGVPAGQISLGIVQFLNMETWPDGFYADPDSVSINVASGQTVQVNFTFKPYTSFIEGTCKVNGTGLACVEINAMALDGMNMRFFSTVSKDDGTYQLGVTAGTIFTLNAEISDYELIDPVNGYFNINVAAGQSVKGKDFTFQATAGVTYIAGTVTYENASPAAGVYVVAINDMELDRSHYQIQYTNGSGNYKFSNVESGRWKVGVYKAGNVSTPFMHSLWIFSDSPSEEIDFVLSPGTGVAAADEGLSPATFYLEQNYPNPFSPGMISTFTNIHYYLDKTTRTEISIYNIAGQRVKRIDNGSEQPGPRQFKWDGRDELGNWVPSGVYIYHLQAGDKSLNRRMVIVR